MREAFDCLFVSAILLAACWSQATSDTRNSTTCVNVSVAINLVDEECVGKSKTKGPSTQEDENSIDAHNVEEMNAYAVCLLKKSSIMDESGKVNFNFDIVKIVKNLYKKTDDKGLGMAFILKSVNKCRNTTGSDNSTLATGIIKCLMANQINIVQCS